MLRKGPKYMTANPSRSRNSVVWEATFPWQASNTSAPSTFRHAWGDAGNRTTRVG